jgi:hypothetical protein
VRKTPRWPRIESGPTSAFIAVFPHECVGQLALNGRLARGYTGARRRTWRRRWPRPTPSRARARCWSGARARTASAQLRAIHNEDCTALAQIARLGPTLWLNILIRALSWPTIWANPVQFRASEQAQRHQWIAGSEIREAWSFQVDPRTVLGSTSESQPPRQRRRLLPPRVSRL